jgi:hypothetical protein
MMSDRKRAKPKSSRTLVIGSLVGGGLLVLLVCCVGGIGGYFVFFPGPSVVGGKWELTEKHEGGRDRRTWEFNPGGTGKVHIHKEFKGKVEDSTGYFDYNLIDGKPPTLEMKIIRAEGAATDRMKREIGQTFRFKVTREGDSLRLTKPETGDSLPLKRVR